MSQPCVPQTVGVVQEERTTLIDDNGSVAGGPAGFIYVEKGTISLAGDLSTVSELT